MEDAINKVENNIIYEYNLIKIDILKVEYYAYNTSNS